jgi:hypothetical protein
MQATDTPPALIVLETPFPESLYSYLFRFRNVLMGSPAYMAWDFERCALGAVMFLHTAVAAWESRLARLAAADAAELDARSTPAQVAAACESIAEEYRDAAAGLAELGQREAATDLRRAARAAEKAAFYALEGDRVARWVGDVLMVRSAREAGVVYAVRVGGCCCKAAEKQQSCWHGQLRCGHERAWETAEAGYALAA